MIDVDHLSPLDRVGRFFLFIYDDMRMVQFDDRVVSADDRCRSSLAT